MKKYGWIPDLPDKRDLYYKLRVVKLPKEVDLRPTKIYDQGQLGSCVGHGVGELDKFVTEKQKKQSFDPSRLFIYYEARRLEGTVKQDAGAVIRDAMKVINKKGVCLENLWPYITRKFSTKPKCIAYANARTHQTIEYSRVPQTLESLKSCLAEGYPFVLGFSVYEYFESEEMAELGLLQMPKKGEQLLGGHCVLCVGYSDDKEMFLIQNSWGEKWGQNGYFWMPYEYMIDKNLVDDIWTLRTVE
jgi:C1A family cysteine protease